jgi:hypothetical protein
VSRRTLAKLRYRAKMRVAVIGAPAGFEVELQHATGLTRVPRFVRGLDLAQGFYTRRAHLERDLPALARNADARTLIWICYPKARALDTDLDRDVIRGMARTAGLRAVAIVAIDEVWSALRVKRIAD